MTEQEKENGVSSCQGRDLPHFITRDMSVLISSFCSFHAEISKIYKKKKNAKTNGNCKVKKF